MKQNTIILIITVIIVAVIIGYFSSGQISPTDDFNESFSLVGTWTSELVNGYYTHEKVLDSDGTFTGTWYVSETGEVYSQVSGTWSATCCELTTVTDHTDTYDLTVVSNNHIKLLIDNENRNYYRG